MNMATKYDIAPIVHEDWALSFTMQDVRSSVGAGILPVKCTEE